MPVKVTKKKKTRKRSIPSAVVHVQATFNNTIISITTDSGEVVAWASAGSAGFKGSRKSTPYAAQIATEKALEKAKSQGLVKASVVVKGIGSGRDAAIRALTSAGLEISSLRDITAIPHNGCRPRKARRG